MTTTIRVTTQNQTVSNTSGSVQFVESSNNDIIDGGIGDTFVVNTGYNYYNSFNDISGGSIVAGVNSAYIGLAGSFSAAANGISSISGNGYTGAQVASNGSTLNLANVTLSNVAVNAINVSGGQTITTGQSGLTYNVSGNGDVFNGAGHDTFVVNSGYASFNTYNEPTGGEIVAGINNAFIGLTNSNLYNSGVSMITANGMTGAQVAGSNAVLNLAGVAIRGVAVDAYNLAGGQAITTTQGNITYNVSGNNDVFNGVGGDIFNVTTGYNFYNSYNEMTGGAAVQADTDNAFIGFSGNFSTANGITAISGNGHSGVQVSGNGSVLNLTGIALSDVAINANYLGGQTITTTQSGLTYNVSGNGDSFNAAGGDNFNVSTAYIYYNSFNEASGNGSVLAGIDNDFIGFSGNFSAASGITSISANGHSGVQVAGNGAVLNLSNIALNGVVISAHQVTGGQTITTTQTAVTYLVTGNADTINGAGGDVFNVKNDYIYYNTYNDTTGGSIFANGDDNFIGLSGSFGAVNGIVTISGNGYDDVTLASNASNVTLDFSNTTVADVTTHINGSSDLVDMAAGSQSVVLGGVSETLAFTTATATGNDTVSGFRAGSGSGYDVISLGSGLAPASFSALLADITQVGSNAVITLANGNTITLDGVTKSSLQACNFNLAAAPVTPSAPTAPVVPVVPVTHANSTVCLSGLNDSVTGPTSFVAASGVAGAAITGPIFGNATISGPASNVTITAQAYNNSIIAGGGNDTIYAGLDGAKVQVSDSDGNNTVLTAQNEYVSNASVVLGNGNDDVVLNGYSNLITLGNGNDTVNAGVGFETINVGNGSNSVSTSGWDNKITTGNGTNVIDAGYGNNSVTVAGGTSTVTASGYSNTITTGAGTTNIQAGAGYETVVTGAGNASIAMSGCFNSITTGTGNAVINAGLGYSTVTVGNGVNSIMAGGNSNVINTAGGSDSVTLTGNGWNNVVNAGAGATTVTGGFGTTYNVDALSTTGGLTVTDFNGHYGDVLNLAAVLVPLAAGGASLSSLIAAQTVGNDLLISVQTAGGAVQVADLQGLGHSSLTGLIANHSVVL